MPRACTICFHPERKLIDAMIADKQPYLRIATKFKLNDKTIKAHAVKHVLPFSDNIELQANAAVLARVMTYRDVVNLPLPEKSKRIENTLWDDYYALDDHVDRMSVMREINKQQAEQAKLAGAYTNPKTNPADIAEITRAQTAALSAKGYTAIEIQATLSELENVSDAVN